MTKVKFCIDSRAGLNSCHESPIYDTVKDLDLDEGEWERMPEDDKNKMAEEWADQNSEIYYEEL